MRNFFDGQGRTRIYEEAYFLYVDEVNPRRTPPIGKITISEGKLVPATDQVHMQMKNNLPSPSLDINK
jgi:hypothetical protein